MDDGCATGELGNEDVEAFVSRKEVGVGLPVPCRVLFKGFGVAWSLVLDPNAIEGLCGMDAELDGNCVAKFGVGWGEGAFEGDAVFFGEVEGWEFLEGELVGDGN